MKPWYLICAFWGTEHRAYFANMCLASILAPGNIPHLKDRPGSTFLIATTRQDWDALIRHPLFEALKSYVNVAFIEIDKIDPQNKFRTMSDAHAAMAVLAHQAQAVATWLAPDMVVSAGAIEAAARHIDAGKVAVRVCALRYDFRGLMGELLEKGHFKEGRVFDVSPRVLAGAAARHLHSETQAYEYDRPYFGCPMPVAPLWRVADDGVIVHTFSWCEFALDYSRVPEHDLNTFNTWTVDGDYLWRQVKDIPPEDIYASYDSDEIFLVGTTREETLHYPKTVWPIFSVPVLGRRLKRVLVRYVRNNLGVIDPLKHKLFERGVFIHGSDITPKWHKIARRAAAEMAKCFKPLDEKEMIRLKQQSDDINKWHAGIPGPAARAVMAADFLWRQARR